MSDVGRTLKSTDSKNLSSTPCFGCNDFSVVLKNPFSEDINFDNIEVRVGFENPAFGNPKHLNNFCGYYPGMKEPFSKYNITYRYDFLMYDLGFYIFRCWNGPYLGRYITIQKSFGPLDLFEVTFDPQPSEFNLLSFTK